MSRFDRRLKGTGTTGGGPRPGTASCSLPSSSTPNSGMLGGNYSEMQNRRINSNRTNASRTVNGLAVLQRHDQQIVRLESRLAEIETTYITNLTKMEVKMQEREKVFDLMTGKYNTEMQKMKNYIKSLQEKLQLNNKNQINDLNSVLDSVTDSEKPPANVQLHIIEN